MTRIDGVLLDLHQTLLRHDPTGWIEAAWSRLGRPAEPLTAWGAETLTSRTDVGDRRSGMSRGHVPAERVFADAAVS